MMLFISLPLWVTEDLKLIREGEEQDEQEQEQGGGAGVGAGGEGIITEQIFSKG